jgi:hypothetical protein
MYMNTLIVAYSTCVFNIYYTKALKYKIFENYFQKAQDNVMFYL